MWIFLSSSLLTDCSLHVAFPQFSCLLKRQVVLVGVFLKTRKSALSCFFFFIVFTDKVVRRMMYLPSMLTRLGCGTMVDNIGLHDQLTKSTSLCACFQKYMNNFC